MGEACIPFGYVRGINPVSLILRVKIESYAIGSAFGRGQACGRRLYSGNTGLNPDFDSPGNHGNPEEGSLTGCSLKGLVLPWVGDIFKLIK